LALALKADGVVEVKLREGPMGRGTHVIQFMVVGTAVKQTTAHQTISPSMVVSLDDPVAQFEAASLRKTS
jgi:hypothetical protein